LVVAAVCAYVSGPADATIYWANLSGNTISASNNNGKDVIQNFITGANGPAEVIVSADHIYWGNATGGCTESGSCPGSIAVANLNGSDVHENFIHADTPYGLAIDGHYIYWSNFGANTIGRANLDGTDADQSFVTGADSYPTRVTVTSTHIYWTTWTTNSVPSSGTIGEANLNGTGVNNHLIYGDNSPVGVAVTSGNVPARCVVPDVVGKKLSAAEKALRKAHCGVGKVRRSQSIDVPKGRVITQSRMTGDSFTPGSKVGLVVSSGSR
jgi:uncharacterized protein YjbI with pentapeptide repeats